MSGATSTLSPLSLRIRRWRNCYLVPSTHPSPHGVQRKLDDMLRHRMTEALAPIHNHLTANDPEALYFIRRLPLEWHVDVAANIDELALHGAQVLAAALARVLAEGENDNVIRFRNRAAYLARFVSDCATGDAWQRWYYASFDGLRHLPTSVAIRTALTEDPTLGLTALLELHDTSKRRVLAALSTYDIQRLLHNWETTAGDTSECFAETLNAALQFPCPVPSIEGHALWLYLSISAYGGTACAPACLAVAALIEIMRDLPQTQRMAWISSFENAISPASHPYLQWLSELPPEARHHGVQQLSTTMDVPVSAMPADGAHTSFGGAFMLLPIIDDMRLAELTKDWPDLETPNTPNLPATQVMRWLLLAHAQGAQRIHAFLADPLWRTLLGVDARVSIDAVAAWLRSLGHQRLLHWRRFSMDGATQTRRNTERQFLAQPASPWPRPWHTALVDSAEQLLSRFAHKIPGFSASSAHYLYTQFLDIGAQVDYRPDHLEVTLEHPPLALLLNLAGLNRGQRNIHWLSTPSLHLYSRE